MSNPLLNPDKTTSGIILDPSTLERVVPSSRRADGTTRKELKIRPGFTPQEDIKAFRPSRNQPNQKQFIPGTNRIKPPPKSESAVPNPFASEKKEKTKAQIKNDKRREKKRAEKAWDESSGEDDVGGGEGMKEAFESGDKARHAGDGAEDGDGEEGGEGGGEGSEMAFPPLSGGAGAPQSGISTDKETPIEPSLPEATPADGEASTTEILSPPPPAADSPESGSTLPSSSTPTTKKTEQPWRSVSKPQPLSKPPTQSQSQPKTSKPHPIQGGRNGPIGLANPPPHPKPLKVKPTPKAPAKVVPEPPRVRKEVRVREGGANDASSLAARLKGLVLETTKPPREREKRVEGGEKA